MTSHALEYHRLARIRPRYRWWRMLLTGLVGIALYAVLLVAALSVLAVAAAVAPGFSGEMNDVLLTTSFFDLDRPWLLLILLVPLILMLPMLFLASRIVEGRGVGFLSSVRGRLRWGWLVRCTALALGVYAVFFAVSLGLGALAGEQISADAAHPAIPLMLLLVIVLIPFQAAAEEYVFRGYLMQLIGGWLRHPVFAIVLPAPLFVLGHGYDIWGGLSVGAFAIVAGWLSWRTGGLEAAIGLHIINNVSIFVLGAFSLVDANATSATPVDLLSSVVVMVGYALIVRHWARARGIERTATITSPDPAPVGVI